MQSNKKFALPSGRGLCGVSVLALLTAGCISGEVGPSIVVPKMVVPKVETREVPLPRIRSPLYWPEVERRTIDPRFAEQRRLEAQLAEQRRLQIQRETAGLTATNVAPPQLVGGVKPPSVAITGPTVIHTAPTPQTMTAPQIVQTAPLPSVGGTGSYTVAPADQTINTTMAIGEEDGAGIGATAGYAPFEGSYPSIGGPIPVEPNGGIGDGAGAIPQYGTTMAIGEEAGAVYLPEGGGVATTLAIGEEG